MSHEAAVRSEAPGLRASRRVSTNFLAVGSGEVFGRLFAFAATLYAARHVGAAGYGIVAFVSSVTLYLSKVADFGIETVGTDEIAKHRDSIARIGSAVLSARLLAAAGLFAIAASTAGLLVGEPERTVFIVYFLTLIPIAASTKWIHLGMESAGPIGLWRVIGEGLTLGLIVTFVRTSSDLWKIPASMLVGDGLVTVMLIGLLLRRGYALRPRWSPEIVLPIFKRALPVLGVFLAGLLIYNLDILFLRFMQPTEVVGLYAAAYSLIGFLANVSTVYGITLLPTLTRLSRRSAEERSLYHTAMAQVFAIALPISVGGMFVAHTAIRLGFGEGYAASASVLQILVWTVVPYALRVVAWAALVAHGEQGLALRAIVYGVIANAVLNFVLIHFYGMTGAAAASVATEALAAALTLYYAVHKGLPLASFARFWRPVVAVLAMSAALWLLWNAPVALQLGAGAATYGFALLCVGGIKLRGRAPALAV
jgi:PST family polysaccharide transporter